MYSAELKIKDTTESITSASFLDWLLSIERDSQLRTSLYEKRYDCNLLISILPFQRSNILSSSTLAYFPQSTYAMLGFASLVNLLFWGWHDIHITLLCREMLGNVRNRLSGSPVVDIRISSTIMKSPSPNCYLVFWDWTILFSDTLNWSDTSLNFDLVPELDLI